MVNKRLRQMIAMCLVIIMCLIMTGCPNVINYEGVETGDFFRSEVVDRFYVYYGVKFSEEELPNVRIEYKASDSTDKVAVFKLDGYDHEKLIGYQLVTLSDKEQWEKQRNEGNTEAPDLSDIKILQKVSAEYDFPIIFIGCYDYQEDREDETVLKNLDAFRKERDKIIHFNSVQEWAQAGMYSGEWIREFIVENYKQYNYALNFANDNLPVVSIEYGSNMTAVFQLDGYDLEKRVGYKFVSNDDEIAWRNERESGNLEAPDPEQFQAIREGALNYEFPVLFFYYPNYWKSTIRKVVEQDDNDFILKLEDWLNMKELIEDP